VLRELLVIQVVSVREQTEEFQQFQVLHLLVAEAEEHSNRPELDQQEHRVAVDLKMVAVEQEILLLQVLHKETLVEILILDLQIRVAEAEELVQLVEMGLKF
jgi:hypothetical protein